MGTKIDGRKLTLNREGRYIQGPTEGKADWLRREYGARPTREPESFCREPGWELVVVVENEAPNPFDGALWVKDEHELRYVQRSAHRDPRRRRWLLVPSHVLPGAPR